jgi:DNA-binding MarR family transcriptional regulator/GNAT superfamily N-acetyltransferase
MNDDSRTEAGPADVAATDIALFRAFNRTWTRVAGLLRSGIHGSRYSMTEGRVLFELARRDPANLLDVRRELELDAGYLTRIVQRFREQGLLETTQSETDGRRQVVRLTEAGRAAFADLDRRSDEQAAAILRDFPPDERRQVTGAMRVMHEALTRSRRPEPYLIRPMRIGDPGWVIARHGELYAQSYGWDATFEGYVARIVADYVEDHDRRREAAWVAEVDGEPAGCVFCVQTPEDATVAQLRLLLVEPHARGLGIGSRLVDECIGFARRAGYRRMVLWTQSMLEEAQRIYETKGFEIEGEHEHHSFGHDLIGRFWSLDLQPGVPRRPATGRTADAALT